MYLIEFINENNKKFLLHDGKNFVGGSKEECERVCQERIICAITADFEVIEVKDYDTLGKMIGFVPGYPYKILDFNNGLTHWMGVEMVCYMQQEDEEMIDLWEIEANTIVNSNEYENSKYDN